MSITENVARVRAQIEEAALRAGRDPKEILLVAATKMNDAARVREAIEAGVDVCGENRVQEMLEKHAQGAYEGVPLHFIGHLQKNKVRQVVGLASLIHGVDSLALLEAISREAEKRSLRQDVLLEVNIGGEAGGDPRRAGSGRRFWRDFCARTDGNSSHLRKSRRKPTFFSRDEEAFC